VDVTGMALPILRETKMITLHIELGDETEAIMREFAGIIGSVMSEVIHK
jgi:hypothetical protein